MTTAEEIDSEARTLAAMAYGEASPDNVFEEMSALSSVLVRQRDARGYQNINDFVEKEKTFSFVVHDSNARYRKFMKATAQEIDKDIGMSSALKAAKNALAGGIDYSNGGYFWDGEDIKHNYKRHFKVKHGIKFLDPSHNIYEIQESSKLMILKKIIKKKVAGKIVIVGEEELGRYDHVYVSTAAYGGTIFWKHNPEYMKVTGAKEFK